MLTGGKHVKRLPVDFYIWPVVQQRQGTGCRTWQGAELTRLGLDQKDLVPRAYQVHSLIYINLLATFIIHNLAYGTGCSRRGFLIQIQIKL